MYYVVFCVWLLSFSVSSCCSMDQSFILFYDSKILMCSYTTHLFICLSDDGHLGCFYFLAITDNVALSICVCFCEYGFSILLDMYPGVEFLSLMITLCLTLWETAILFSKVTIPFTFLQAMCKGTNVFPSLLALIFGVLFNIHPNEMLSYCDFDLHLPNTCHENTEDCKELLWTVIVQQMR